MATPSNPFPGVFKQDYRFVVYGGQTYIVYVVQMPGGGRMEVSWRLNKEDLEAFGVKPDQIAHIGKNAFSQLNNLGSWDQVSSSTLPEEHPFRTFLKDLGRQHGDVSWLQDENFVSVLLEGWAEGWSEPEIQNVLEQTKWYKSRNEAQRAWELDLNPADRRTQMKSWTTQVSDALRELYGADFNLKEAGITQRKINKWAEEIASGRWGDPSQGFQQWLSSQQHKAEDVEGTPAWISRQQELEAQREFANRPEEMFQALRDEAMYWLGPQALPSNDTLRKWANDLVTEISSEADWKQFLQKQTQTLYPFLGANVPWQQFADPYKAIAEKTWGAPVNWDHPLLQQLGGVDEKGSATGSALSFYDFEKLVRQDPRYWGGPVAREEGFALFNQLQNTFQGVQ